MNFSNKVSIIFQNSLQLSLSKEDLTEDGSSLLSLSHLQN